MKALPFGARFAVLALAIGTVAQAQPAQPAANAAPPYLRDRGPGIPSSLFGTFIERGQWLVYPSFEHVQDQNFEYQPDVFGVGPDVDFRGDFEGSTGQLFLGYGVKDWLALEIELGYTSVEFEKSPRDTFSTPSSLEESGLGDVEGQLRVRLIEENARRPEVFGFGEITIPSQKDKILIGDEDFDFRPGLGVIRGFSWGTLSFRTDLEYNHEESHVDLGETALQYVKRLSRTVRLSLGAEGGEGGSLDEWEFISGTLWRVTDVVHVKVDNAIGISSKATDWTLQAGVLFSLRPSKR